MSRSGGFPSPVLNSSELRIPMDRTQTNDIPLISTLHPGETVLEYLEAFGWSQRDLSRRTDLAPKTISEICSGKAPITPTTALAFEKAFQRPAHWWLALQRRYDEAEARQEIVLRSGDWDQWAKNFPLREMRRLGFDVPQAVSDADAL